VNRMKQKGQSTLELIMVMGVITAIITMIIPFVIKLYFTIHADALMKQTLLEKLAEKSLDDNTHYRIRYVQIYPVGDGKNIVYDVWLNEVPDGDNSTWEDLTATHISDEIKKQTNIETVALVMQDQQPPI